MSRSSSPGWPPRSVAGSAAPAQSRVVPRKPPAASPRATRTMRRGQDADPRIAAAEQATRRPARTRRVATTSGTWARCLPRRAALTGAGVTNDPEVVVADAGYWHRWNGGAHDLMRSVLATDRGTELYRQRAQLVEPIFGDPKHNRRFTRSPDAAEPPRGPSDASWPPPTACSSSTSTSSPARTDRSGPAPQARAAPITCAGLGPTRQPRMEPAARAVAAGAAGAGLSVAAPASGGMRVEGRASPK